MVIGLIFALTCPVQAAGTNKVNINSADAKALQALKGIGQKKAQAIIDYRTKNGKFQKPEDLMKVSGIGPKTYDGLKSQISVGTVSAQATQAAAKTKKK
jgi:competence protein ComEA